MTPICSAIIHLMVRVKLDEFMQTDTCASVSHQLILDQFHT